MNLILRISFLGSCFSLLALSRLIRQARRLNRSWSATTMHSRILICICRGRWQFPKGGKNRRRTTSESGCGWVSRNEKWRNPVVDWSPTRNHSGQEYVGGSSTPNCWTCNSWMNSRDKTVNDRNCVPWGRRIPCRSANREVDTALQAMKDYNVSWRHNARISIIVSLTTLRYATTSNVMYFSTVGICAKQLELVSVQM